MPQRKVTASQGEWRIVEMEIWNEDFLDLTGPTRIASTPRAKAGSRWLHLAVLGVSSSRAGRATTKWDDASAEVSIDLDPTGALNGEICLDDGAESEFRAALWPSSTAC